jgi:ligand-binding SRPBCC domain-containing protein
MAVISLTLSIAAPRQRCFDLARSIDVHLRSTSATDERAVAGVSEGLIGLGQEVTWEARHFGIRQRFTSRITAYDPPRHFRDEMIRGAFHRFAHDHEFVAEAEARTTMIDRLEFAAPGGLLGRLVDKLVLERYLRRFLIERNQAIRRIAESDEWKQYLRSGSGGLGAEPPR